MSTFNLNGSALLVGQKDKPLLRTLIPSLLSRVPDSTFAKGSIICILMVLFLIYEHRPPPLEGLKCKSLLVWNSAWKPVFLLLSQKCSCICRIALGWSWQYILASCSTAPSFSQMYCAKSPLCLLTEQLYWDWPSLSSLFPVSLEQVPRVFSSLLGILDAFFNICVSTSVI